MRITMGVTAWAAVCVAALMSGGCESPEIQAQQIRKVLAADRKLALQSLDALPTATAVEKLKTMDLSGCPRPFQQAWVDYVAIAEQIVGHSTLGEPSQDRFLSTATQKLDEARLEVSRVALAYGVAVE